MIRLLLIAALGAFAMPAFAQDTSVNSTSNSSTTSNSSSSTQSAIAGNQLGVNSELNFNSPGRQRVEYGGKTGNAAVPLAAAVSFSGDYCGGTVSGGASAAGISIGGSKVNFDPNCQALRRAEKFGMAAVTAHNLGMREDSAKLERMAVWEMCASAPLTADACYSLGLIDSRQLQRIHDATPAPIGKK